MNLIASALRYNAYLAPCAASKLGGRDAGLHGEFLHSIGDPEVAERRVDLSVDNTDAIQHEDVRLLPRAGDVKSATLSPASGRQGAGRNQRQIQVLAGIQRHAGDGPAIHNAA